MTKDSITIGLVGDLSGPISDIYKTGIDTIDAWVKDINAHGGIHGRKVILKIADDGLNPQNNASATRTLASQVFAFVGSVSAVEAGGIPFINADHIPDIGSASTQPRRDEPTYAHLGSQGTGVSSNLAAFAKTLGVSSIAFAAFNDPSAEKSIANQVKAFQSQGISTCYQTVVNFGAPDYTSTVVAMKQHNCDAFDMQVEVSASAKVQQEVVQQNWHPKMILDQTPSYVDKFVDLSGGAQNVEGVYIQLQNAPVTDPLPEMQHFISVLKQYHPEDDPKGLFAIGNWADALTFAKALDSLGDNPTRSGLMSALANIHNYDAGGIVPPDSPMQRTVNPCMVMVQYRSGKAVRAFPSSGFDCSGTIFG